MIPFLFRARRSWCAVILLLGVLATGHPVRAQQPVVAGVTDSATTIRLDTLLDLPTVISRALAASPQATMGEEGVRRAQSEGRVAKGAYLPSVNLNSAALRSDIMSGAAGVPGAPGVPSASAYSAGVSSSLDLYTGGRRSADVARTRANLGAAEATSVSTQFAVTLLAQRAYYEALRGADLLAAARVAGDARRARARATRRIGCGPARRRSRTSCARASSSPAREQQQLAARDTLQTAAYALGRWSAPTADRRAAARVARADATRALRFSEIVQLAVTSAPAVRGGAGGARGRGSATRARVARHSTCRTSA